MTDFRQSISTAYSLSEYEKRLLINENSSPPKLYGLAKIHKPNVPIRPVVSYKSAPAYKLAQKTNDLFYHYTKYNNPYTINNSLEVIDKIKDILIPQSAKIVSFDVVNLFPSVPVPHLKEVIENKLRTLSNKTYKMSDGLPMGSPLSPLFANFYMHHLKKDIFKNNFFKSKIGYWYRYVDDILCLFLGTHEELKLFHNFLNTLSHKIKFTMEINDNGTKINFLDLTIFNKDNKHCFSIYHKPSSSDVIIPMFSNNSINHKRAAFCYYFDRL